MDANGHESMKLRRSVYPNANQNSIPEESVDTNEYWFSDRGSGTAGIARNSSLRKQMQIQAGWLNFSELLSETARGWYSVFVLYLWLSVLTFFFRILNFFDLYIYLP